MVQGDASRYADIQGIGVSGNGDSSADLCRGLSDGREARTFSPEQQRRFGDFLPGERVKIDRIRSRRERDSRESSRVQSGEIL